MLYIFLLSVIVLLVTIVIYIVNEEKIHKHVQKLEHISSLKQEMLQSGGQWKSFASTMDIPSCTGIYVMSNDLTTMIWSDPRSTVMLQDIMLDANSRQKIIVRALTGGGFVRLPWRQRTSENALKNVVASVFKLDNKHIGLILLCD